MLHSDEFCDVRSGGQYLQSLSQRFVDSPVLRIFAFVHWRLPQVKDITELEFGGDSLKDAFCSTDKIASNSLSACDSLISGLKRAALDTASAIVMSDVTTCLSEYFEIYLVRLQS